MSIALENKDARIEFKTSKEIKHLLQDAANALGMDLSGFLVSTATQRAKDVMKKERILMLSKQEWQAFEEEVVKPSKPTKALEELMNLEEFER